MRPPRRPSAGDAPSSRESAGSSGVPWQAEDMIARRQLPALALGTGAALALAACDGQAAGDGPTPSDGGAAAPAEPTPTPATPTDSGPEITVEVLATGLAAPWSIAFHGETALVSERDSGRILELLEDGELREVGVVEGVAHGGEGGLLGLAVDGDHLFVASTGTDGGRIQRYGLSGERGAHVLGETTTLLADLPSASVHNGGRLLIGPDGLLYATVGDAGERAAAQDPEVTAGKILRLTLDGEVPEDNPFPGSPVWTLGHRNPQGLAVDAEGTIYASEFGQDAYDELNVLVAGGNYGWPVAEGIAGEDPLIDPVQQWTTDVGGPSGIAVLGDRLLIAHLTGRRLRVVPLDDLAVSTEHLVGEYGRLRDVVAAPDGSAWVLTNTTDGRGDPHPDGDRILRLTLD